MEAPVPAPTYQVYLELRNLPTIQTGASAGGRAKVPASVALLPVPAALSMLGPRTVPARQLGPGATLLVNETDGTSSCLHSVFEWGA